MATSSHRITFTVEGGGPSDLNPNTRPEYLVRCAQLLEGIAVGAKQGRVHIHSGATQAVGTMVFSSFADADTVVINGTTLTGKTTPSGTAQWAVGASDEACANNFVAKVNASALSAISGIIYATRRATCAVSSMADADTVTINGVVFTCKATPTEGNKGHFQLGTSDTVTAVNLAKAINMNGDPALAIIAATSATTTVTINFDGTLVASNSAHGTITSTTAVLTCVIAGVIGNLCTLTTGGGHGTATAPTGGADGTEKVFANASYV